MHLQKRETLRSLWPRHRTVTMTRSAIQKQVFQPSPQKLQDASGSNSHWRNESHRTHWRKHWTPKHLRFFDCKIKKRTSNRLDRHPRSRVVQSSVYGAFTNSSKYLLNLRDSKKRWVEFDFISARHQSHQLQTRHEKTVPKHYCRKMPRKLCGGKKRRPIPIPEPVATRP